MFVVLLKSIKGGARMLHHRTDDPAEQASSIADREAEGIYKETGDYKRYVETWLSVYRQVLREFVYQE